MSWMGFQGLGVKCRLAPLRYLVREMSCKVSTVRHVLSFFTSSSSESSGAVSATRLIST